MRLAVPGEDTPPPSGPVLIGGLPLPLYYTGLFAALIGRFWRVIAPEFDFRQPIATDAAALVALIRSEAASAPLSIVCHSRGGLVTRVALGILAAAGQANLVGNVVGLGVPHSGALIATTALACWNPVKRQIAALGRWLPSRATSYIGLNQVAATIRSWPSLYELLPAPSAPWAVLTPPTKYYLPATYAGSDANPVPAYLSAAVASWAALPPIPDGVNWVHVAGFGVGTYSDLPDVTEILQRGSMEITNDGDGAVLIASAIPDGRVAIRTPTAHEMLPWDGRLMATISEAMAGRVTKGTTLPGDLLQISF